jgi:hypothetical protein
MLGGEQDNIHEWYYFDADAGFLGAFIVDMTTGIGSSYAAYGGDVGTEVTWNDFANYSAPRYFLDTNTSGTNMGVYSGTFTNRFRWTSGYGIYLGRRHQGQYIQGYVKEVAIFTTALTDAQAKTFRSAMYARWP